MSKVERYELEAVGVKVKLYREKFNSRYGDYVTYWDRKGPGLGWKAQSKRAKQYRV